MNRDNYKFLISRYISNTDIDDESTYTLYCPIIISDSKAQANKYVKYLLKFLTEVYIKLPKWPETYVNWAERDIEYYDNLACIEKERKKYLDKIVWPLNHNMSDLFNVGINKPMFCDTTFSINKIKYVMKD